MTIPVVAVSRLGGQFFAFVAQQKDGKDGGTAGSAHAG